MFRRIYQVFVTLVTFVFDNWFMAATRNPFVPADDVVQGAIGGDLIQFQRRKFGVFSYNHWAVYIGRKETIGVGVPHRWTSLLGGDSQIEKRTVSDLCLKKCRVNNLDEDARRRRRSAFPNGRIVNRALACLNIGIVYHLLLNNCEHFATFCRYGFPFSMQVGQLPGRLVGRLRRDSEILDSVTQYALQFSGANLNF